MPQQFRSIAGIHTKSEAVDVNIVTTVKSKPSPSTSRRAKKSAKDRRDVPATPTAAGLTNDAGIAAAAALGIKLTSPDKAVYPGITKAQLVAYYDAVAERMLPHVANRPLTLLRRPTGSPKGFFQKHDSGGFPDAFKKVRITETIGKDDMYLYIDDAAGLAACVQMSSLELHVWGSHVDNLELPDRIVFDIDPDEGLGFDSVRDAAQHIREELAKWALESFPMLTGGKGIHVIAPLRPVLDWPDIKLFCRTFAEKLALTEPDRFTANIRKAKRSGRMFVDYLRNERGATAVAPFSTRAKPGCPVAVPVSWDELGTIESASGFSLSEAIARANAPDPWPNYFDLTQSVTKAMLSSVAGDKL